VNIGLSSQELQVVTPQVLSAVRVESLRSRLISLLETFCGSSLVKKADEEHLLPAMPVVVAVERMFTTPHHLHISGWQAVVVERREVIPIMYQLKLALMLLHITQQAECKVLHIQVHMVQVALVAQMEALVQQMAVEHPVLVLTQTVMQGSMAVVVARDF
jgi:hypothetical protein